MATDVLPAHAADGATATGNSNNNSNSTDDVTVRFLYRGHSYRVPTQFVRKKHPGGARMLMRYRDADMTAAFDAAAHSADAYEMLEEWCEDDDNDDDVSNNNNNKGGGSNSSGAAERRARRKAALQQRAEARRAAEQRWRWRSTVFAFTVAGVLAAVAVRHAPPLRT